MTDHIIQDWKKGKFSPVYWLEGEEDYYIDQVVRYAEHHILSEQDAGFNLSVFYGRDAAWADVINACRRYPMFAERQVIILKEAQLMRDVEKLEPYIEHPLATTVLVVAYKGKKLDRRTKLPKVIEKHGVMVTTKKMYDDKLPDWTVAHLTAKGYTINQRAVMLIVEHIGNDLARIVNELEKLTVNLHGRTAINEDDIEQFIGISKEYNVFELQRAIARIELPRAIAILNYFDSNPKAGPIQQVLPVLYMFFSKVWMLFGVDPGDGKGAAAQLGVNPYFMKDYQDAASRYGQQGVSRILLLLHHYNLKGIGMGTGGASDGDLMREMVVKMMQG